MPPARHLVAQVVNAGGAVFIPNGRRVLEEARAGMRKFYLVRHEPQWGAAHEIWLTFAVSNMTIKNIFQIIILLLLCVLIGLAMTDPIFIKTVNPLVRQAIACLWDCVAKIAWVLSDVRRAVVVLLLWIPLYYLYRSNQKFEDKVSEKIDALRGAAFDLVRLMEITTDGTAKKAEILDNTTYRFAVNGPAEIIGAYAGPATTAAAPADGEAPKPAASGTWTSPNIITMPHDLVKLATETANTMRERRLGDMATMAASTASVRHGLQVFWLLMMEENVQSAHFNLTEYMKKQRDDAGKKIQNFTELKVFFGLPTEWPTGTQPEELQKAGLSSEEGKAIAEALKRGREKVFSGMFYNPPVTGSDKPIVIRGKNVLHSMRRYLYNPNTYNPALVEENPAE